MFGNFLIGLREGLEAALVVSLLIAYLVRTDNKKALKPLWLGVGIGVGLSIALAAMLTFTSTSILQSFESREAFGGIMSLIAVGFVTWMIFWMKRMGRHLKDDLESKMQSALAGGTVAIVLCAFMSVSREGVETSLFFWSSLNSVRESSGSSMTPLWGFLIGIATAVGIAVALYRRLLHINLGKFFARTGMLLVFVAAGIAAYAFHDLQEAGLIGGINNVAFDATSVLNPNSIHGALFRGVIPISPQPTWLEISVFTIYLGVVMFFYLNDKAANSLKKILPVSALVLVVTISLGACSSKKYDSTLAVTSDAKKCEVTSSPIKPGKVELKVTNDDSKVTEVYVLQNEKIIDELEDVGPGQTRSSSIELEEGSFSVKCKPGMKGDGIKDNFEVKK